MKGTQKTYTIQFREQFIEDVGAHKKAGQKSIINKIDTLIDELREHPTTGTGKPEPLRGDRKGEWSRRINKEHRLIYEIQEDVITVVLVSAYGHYDDK
ncbi:MAG: Txe/YoeB family addiction module toxin [Tannerella sp.]|jgi:toxin YoeB|nr:Txe/YoeB family addiction module toxin [Tannerella sp.]